MDALRTDESADQLRLAVERPAVDLATADRGVVTSELGHEVVRLTRATHQVKTQVAARATDGGTDWTAYVLLFRLVAAGPQRLSALAEAVGVDPSTASRQVADLVKAGLVERGADPDDGRASLLSATPDGHQTYAAMRASRDSAFEHMLAGWSEADVRQLTILLARFNDSFTDHRSRLCQALTGVARRTEETA